MYVEKMVAGDGGINGAGIGQLQHWNYVHGNREQREIADQNGSENDDSGASDRAGLIS
jgi:hypothetical protein